LPWLRAASKRAKESVALLHFDAAMDTEGIYHMGTRGPLYDK
jgi:arginase family enzyme